MQALRLTRVLGRIDTKSAARDPLLRWIGLIPIVVAVAARFVLPLVLHRLSGVIPGDVDTLRELITGSALLLITPTMCGMMVGFLVLDQRDDRTLTALQVTPMSLNSYLLYRLLGPMAISGLMTVIAFAVAGLDEPGFAAILLAACAAAPLAPLVALALATFAENKVQGFALLKGASLFMIGPLGAHFVPSHWQLAFGILPTFWPVRLLWSLQVGEPIWWLYLLVGTLYHALLIAMLVRRFQRVMYR